MELTRCHKTSLSYLIIFSLLLHHCLSYQLSPIERSIIEAFNSLTDLRQDFSRHVLESVSLPIIAPILVRNGAFRNMRKAITATQVEEQLKNSGLPEIMHGLSLLPLTLPVSAIHLLSAPVAVPYKRRVGRAILEQRLRQEIGEVIKQLVALAEFTRQQEYKFNVIPIVPQNTLDQSSTIKDLYLNAGMDLIANKLKKSRAKP